MSRADVADKHGPPGDVMARPSIQWAVVNRMAEIDAIARGVAFSDLIAHVGG